MRYVNGLGEPTTIFEAAAHRHNIRVACSDCGHASVYDPHQLWWLFERKGWVGTFSDAAKRFWCRACGTRLGHRVKHARIELTETDPTIILPFPDERVWKRAVSRFRS